MIKRAALLLTLMLGMHTLGNAQSALPPDSIYNLKASLINHAGQKHGLDMYRGHSVLITMFYGSCPAACPLLIDTVRSIETAVGPQQKAKLRVLLISVDPDRDTPEALQQLVALRRIDTERWTLAQTDATTVRKIAALLNIQYRKLPNGEFNHSSIVSLLTPTGEIVQHTAKLGQPDPVIVSAVVEALR